VPTGDAGDLRAPHVDHADLTFIRVQLPERQVVAEVAAAVGLVEGRPACATCSILARLEPVATRRISRAADPVARHRVCGDCNNGASSRRAPRAVDAGGEASVRQ
jgi:hypothetical protein